jgi:hypothetical protein
LVFGQGVAKTARKTANSGQFSATFYGLFRNLTFSHFSRSRAWFPRDPGKPLQDVSRTSPGRVPEGCLGRVSGAASQELLQTASQTPSLEGCLEGVWSSFPGSCSRLLQTATRLRHRFGSLPPTRLHLAQVRVAKLASLLKSPQPVMACHDRLGWVEQTCQASQAG